jgi:hypothetical protein
VAEPDIVGGGVLGEFVDYPGFVSCGCEIAGFGGGAVVGCY